MENPVKCFHQQVKHVSHHTQSIQNVTDYPWIEGDFSWTTRFMLDSELHWRDSTTPVNDL